MRKTRPGFWRPPPPLQWKAEGPGVKGQSISTLPVRCQKYRPRALHSDYNPEPAGAQRCSRALRFPPGPLQPHQHRPWAPERADSVVWAETCCGLTSRGPGLDTEAPEAFLRLGCRIYKALLQLSNKMTNNPVEKGAKYWKRQFSKTGVKKFNAHMKRC